MVWQKQDGKMPQRFKLRIHKATTRTYPGAGINRNHDLVLCNSYEQKLRTQKKINNSRVRFDVEKLKLKKSANTTLKYHIQIKN